MNLEKIRKPVPEPDAESGPFWEAARQHRLIIQKCKSCNTCRFPATTFCAQCQSTDAEWIESKGEGSVFSWVVVRHPIPKEAYADEVPYVVALVTLDEGVRMVSNIVGCAPADVKAGMRLRVEFTDTAEGVSLPRFRPI